MPVRTRRARLEPSSQDGPQPGAAAAPSLASMPLEILHIIRIHLSVQESLALSGVAKGLVAPFGSSCRSVCCIRNRPGVHRELSALVGYIRRQESVLHVFVYAAPCIFPTIEALAGSGVGQRLNSLSLSLGTTGALTTLTAEDGRGVAALTRSPRTFLPALQRLELCWDGPSWLHLDILLGALARGAAPSLRTLRLEYYDEIAQQQFDALADVLAEALHARRGVEGCRPLTCVCLTSDCLEYPDLGTYPRNLWAALLPTADFVDVEEAEDDAQDSIIDALLEFGCPNLQELYVPQSRLARGLGSFPRLEKLKFGEMDAETLVAVQEAAAAAGGWDVFLPSLREIDIAFSGQEEDEMALIAAMGQAPFFPGVQKLCVSAGYCPVRPGRAVAAALAAGVFASVTELELWEFKGGDVGLLVAALAASECARCLSSLEMVVCQVNAAGEFASLGAAMGGGRFPALTRLHLSLRESHAGAVKAFAQALTPAHAPPLEELSLSLAKVVDADVIAVAAALREGGLGSRLRRLDISGHVPEITLVGATALADALSAGAQHMQRLKELRLVVPSLDADGTRAFLERALAACPRLIRVTIGCQNLDRASKEALWAFMEEKRGPQAELGLFA